MQPGYACDDDEGIYFEDNEVKRVVHTRPDAKAYYVSLVNGQVVEKEFVQTEIIAWRSRMNRPAPVLVLAAAACAAAQPSAPDSKDIARWQREARAVTIIRDDWGIAHVYGKTDADAVFGMVYAQAEDDFNRVETNYLNSLGRLAEAEGESKIYQDLRMKLFIDPADLEEAVRRQVPTGCRR